MGKHSKHDPRARRAADHGAPGGAHGAGKAERDDRRAGRTQTVRVGLFGGTKVVRGGREGDLRDRWNRR